MPEGGGGAGFLGEPGLKCLSAFQGFKRSLCPESSSRRAQSGYQVAQKHSGFNFLHQLNHFLSFEHKSKVLQSGTKFVHHLSHL